MNTHYYKEFEENLKTRLHSEELPFETQAWDKMENLLNGDGPDSTVVPNPTLGTPKGVLDYLLLFAIAAATFILLSYLFTRKDLSNTTTSTTIVNNESIAQIDNSQPEVLEPITAYQEPVNNEVINNITLDDQIGTDVLLNDQLSSDIQNSELADNAPNIAKEEQSSTIINAANSSKEELENSSEYYTTRDNIRGTNQNYTPASSTINAHNNVAIENKPVISNQIVSSSQGTNNPIIKDVLPVEIEIASKEELNRSLVSNIDPAATLMNGLVFDETPTEPAFFMVDMKPKNIASKHNILIGAETGYASLDISEANYGGITPNAILAKDFALKLSYIYRPKPFLGIEVGAKFRANGFMYGKFIEGGTFGLGSNEYADHIVTHNETDFLTHLNLHYYQYINDRLELDLFAGYQMNNPFETSGGHGRGSSSNWRDGTWLTVSQSEETEGFHREGGFNFGFNLNLLTRKRNSLNIGLSYVKTTTGGIDGNYGFFQSGDNLAVQGDYNLKSDGVKFNIGYNIALQKSRNRYQRYSNIGDTKQKRWFIELKSGTKLKKSFQTNELNALQDTLPTAIAFIEQKGKSIFSLNVGHYISEKMAIRTGLEVGTIKLENVAPDGSLVLNSSLTDIYPVVSLPITAQYDLFSKGIVNVYADAGGSMDFKFNQSYSAVLGSFFSSYLTNEERTTFSAHVGGGAELKMFGSTYIGIYGRYNHGFADLYSVNQAATSANIGSGINPPATINVNSSNVSFGLSIKQVFKG